MAVLNMLLSVSEPNGVWETIIKAFESGVGSYILAVVLLTLVIRIIWAPLDTINKKINKKNTRIQMKMQPELEKIKARYGADRNLLNQKTQELYKRYNFSMTGSCVFMLVFLALNMVIFFTLFAGLNNMADYKISQQYDYLKYNYANVLNVVNEKYESNEFEIFKNYENISFKIIEESEIVNGKNQIVKKIVVNNGETEIANEEFKTDFSYKTTIEKENESGEIIQEEEVISSDEAISQLIYKFVTLRQVTNEDEIKIDDPNYVGGELIEENSKVTLKEAIEFFSLNYIQDCYENSPEKSNFLWIENYWVADSPFTKSILTFEEFKNEIGSNNVSKYENTIYNAFMPSLSNRVGRVNGYLILAILSIGISFLAIFLTNLGNKQKGQKTQAPAGGKILMIIMPLIMGIFAIFYNSVFAIYMVVSQAISAALAPLENLIIKKWEAHQEKKEEEKNKLVVDYRRK